MRFQVGGNVFVRHSAGSKEHFLIVEMCHDLFAKAIQEV